MVHISELLTCSDWEEDGEDADEMTWEKIVGDRCFFAF